jgi:hypothetical protein
MVGYLSKKPNIFLDDPGKLYRQRNFMKEFYSLTKTQGLRNKVDTFVQLPMETIAEALERFNEYMRAEFLEWHISFLMRRMEKMDI